jgi:hypothetical protein
VSVSELKASDTGFVDQFLPLSRLSEQIGEGSTAQTLATTTCGHVFMVAISRTHVIGSRPRVA